MLVVDDEALTREILVAQLQGAASGIDQAEDGFAALRLFRETRYAAVLLDNQMPGMDGCATVREMRLWENQQGLAATLVVVITSSDFPGDQQRILDAGATAYLLKPVKMRELQSLFGALGTAPEHPMERLLPRFFTHAAEMLGDIECSEEPELVLQRFHQLCGMVAVFGFSELTDDLKAVMTAAQQGILPDGATFERLRRELAHLEASLRT